MNIFHFLYKKILTFTWNEVYDYIRAEECEIPKYLCDMLIDVDERSDEIWETIEQLPVVLCQRM